MAHLEMTIYIYIHGHIYIYTRAYIYIFTFIIYIYTDTHKHIDIHEFTYIYPLQCSFCFLFELASDVLILEFQPGCCSYPSDAGGVIESKSPRDSADKERCRDDFRQLFCGSIQIV